MTPHRPGEVVAVWRPFEQYYQGIMRRNPSYHEPTYSHFENTLGAVRMLVEMGFFQDRVC